MKLKSVSTARYNRNPIVEVVTQVRFQKLPIINDPNFAQDQLKTLFAAVGHPNLTEERGLAVSLKQASIEETGDKESELSKTEIPATYHYRNDDDTSRFSVNPEFFAFSSSRYSEWSRFIEVAMEGYGVFRKALPDLLIDRVGLRYKDLIDRDELGLSSQPWGELLSPSLVGIFANDLFSDSKYNVGDVHHAAQSILKLEDCHLLLQTALLISREEVRREAFLIDSDFYHQAPAHLLNAETVGETLNSLHKNASALFRSCIRDTLHLALGPQPR
jgi:uncharacterized protein (TIGR04255 family)